MSAPAPGGPATAVDPRKRAVRLGIRWVLAIVGGLVIVFALGILVRRIPAVEAFIADWSGFVPLPAGAPLGIPAWLSWQHFLNSLFLLLIVRTAFQIKSRKRPPAFWTRDNDGPIRTKRPPRRLSIHVWFHLSLDALWVLNGIVFAVLLFATGQWMRIVPTDWSVIPHALSAFLQYASLQWPTEDPWLSYNALQLLSYFGVVFILAPLAVLTGLRLSSVWPQEGRWNRWFSESLFRKVHVLVLWGFLVFVVLHVGLVLLNGPLANLSAMYAAQEDAPWLGVGLFVLSLAALAGAWLLASPDRLKKVAARFGKVR
ncbi:cytochrome b/b6 domain-containing protein [Agromyces seonyuensis]|uniref:cytochrome b/b6 domain-containing protein n=1 Tax=Agromyces seonyuensis TaxID=2662446 RepID=UPI003014C772